MKQALLPHTLAASLTMTCKANYGQITLCANGGLFHGYFGQTLNDIARVIFVGCIAVDLVNMHSLHWRLYVSWVLCMLGLLN